MNLQTRFLKLLRKRLNTQLAIQIGLVGLSVGVLVAFVYCLSFIWRGYSVPILGYVLIFSVTGLAIFLVTWNRRKSIEQAAKFADREWALKDVLTTAYHFRIKHEEGRIYELVQRQADEQVARLDVRKVSFIFHRKLGAVSLLLLLATFWMLTLPASDAVLAQQAKEQMTADRTEEVQLALEKYLQEMEKDLNDDEKEALKLNELKKWVKELKKTGDEREALKQFAKLEQKISKNISELEQRKDEKMLKNIAAELMKAELTEAKKLGKDLDMKEFKQAAKKLEKMKMSKAEKLDIKENVKPKTLTEQQKKLAKMRELSKRMAHANSKMGKSGEGKRGKQGKMGKAGKNGQAGGKMGEMAEGDDLQAMLDELDEALEELEGDLEELAMEEGEFDEDEFGDAMGRIDGDLDRLSKKLRKLGARRKARSKLKKMRQGLAQAQSYAAGRSNSMAMGGKRAGEGSDHSQRKEKSALKENDQFAQLSGIKRKGPSNSSIEDAESGTGVSRRRGEAKERSYQRQFESFVHRDDVPEDLKTGVREYLKSIHQPPEAE